MSPCPLRAQLRQLVTEELQSPEAQALEAHVETCAACQRVLEELIGDLALPEDHASASSGHPTLDEELVADLVRRLSQAPAAAGVETLGDVADPTSRVPAPLGNRRRYAPGRLHARGGLGEVWVVRDADLGREVALKELRPEQADNPAVVARFLEEARITGQLEHPGIVPVYELAAGAEGQRPFYTMRFIRGRTLNDAVGAYHEKRESGQAGPLDLRELLGAFLSVCNAVAYVHARGVIHRDIKGQNIVLGDFGEVIVLDWGLAKILGSNEGETVPASVRVEAEGRDQTVQGQILGTPAYMAPEQAQGRLDLIDQRSDVYSLGAVLYEILTGQPPFTGPNTHEVLEQVIQEPPVPPRQRLASIPPALEAICLKALAKRPAQRYSSARELAQEIERWLADEPVAAYPEPWKVRARRWLGRHRTLTTAAVAAVLVAAVSLAIATFFLKAANEREHQSRTRAEANFKLAHDAVDRYFTKVSQSDKLKARGLETLRRDLLEQAKDFYECFLQEQADEPGLRDERAGAYWRLGKISELIGATDDAARYYQEALAAAEQLARDHPDDSAYQRNWATTLQDAAILHYRTGKIEQAREEMAKALSLREQLVQNHPDSAEYREGLGRTLGDAAIFHMNTGQWPEARAAYERALLLYEQLAKEHPENPTYSELSSSIFYSLGQLHRVSGRPAEAVAALEESRKLRRQLVDDFPEVPRYQDRLARSLIELGGLYMRAGDPPRAKKAYEESASLFEGLVRDHPDVPEYRDGQGRSLGALGAFHLRLGQKPQAQANFEKTLLIFEELVRTHPDLHEYQNNRVQALRSLAEVFRATGQLPQAEASLTKALPLALRLVKQYPKIQEYQTQLVAIRLDRAGTMASLGEHSRSTAETEELLKEANLTGLNVYDATCVYALAVAAVAKDAKLTEAERHKLAESYAARALLLLGQAVDKGYRDFDNIQKDTDLDALRPRADFQKLVRELSEKAKTKGP
jgi:serine/threonine-protein kinase